MKEPMGRFGSFKPARARRMASETASMASSWPINALVQLLFHVEELLVLAFDHAGDGDAGPDGDDFRDVLFGDDVFAAAGIRLPAG